MEAKTASDSNGRYDDRGNIRCPVNPRRVRALFADGQWRTLVAMAAQLSRDMPMEQAVAALATVKNVPESVNNGLRRKFYGTFVLTRRLIRKMCEDGLVVRRGGRPVSVTGVTEPFRCPEVFFVLKRVPKKAVGKPRAGVGKTGITYGQLFEAAKDLPHIDLDWAVAWMRPRVKIDQVREKIKTNANRNRRNPQVDDWPDEDVLLWYANDALNDLARRGRLIRTVSYTPVVGLTAEPAAAIPARDGEVDYD